MMLTLKRIILFIALSASTALYAAAQSDASISITPTYPEPYEDIVLTLSSYNFDINLAAITWKRAGQTLLSGVGAKKLTLTTGDVGQSIPITATIVPQDGTTITKSVTISPQAVDLFFESKESYAPPFYQGKTLPSEGSVVRVVAFPHMNEQGRRLSSSALSYNWYANGEFLDGASGIGKSSATISLDYLNDSTPIRVVVRSPQGNTIEETLSIYPHAVKPMVYAYDEILGVQLNRAFVRRMELIKGITISLEPFFLSSNGGLGNSASYEWYIDGLPVTPQEKTLLSLQPKEDSYGARTLLVVVNNTKRALQRAEAKLELVFDTRN